MVEKENRGIDIDKKKLADLQNTMLKHYKEKDDGYIIRYRYKWKNEGEKCTAYFFNLEKTRQKNNTIKEIKDKNGTLHTDDGEILDTCGDFYDTLFDTKNIPQQNINEYLEKTNIDKTLTDNQKDMCDEKLTEKELKSVVKNLKHGKSPGCDGLTPEFYTKYWDIIKDLYMDMLEEVMEKGELPYTMRKALLALLYKKGDSTLLKNYRPISLTNYDYKIICFALANRLQKVLKDIIKDDQTGYIKNRYIGTNARLIEEYFEDCEKFQIPRILLFLDFEKAFDSLKWNFMMSTLEKFNFGNNFRGWIKILYNKPIISIKNNGWISRDISLKRGVRQGCPLSALLFVIAVEIMAINIRNNNQITGFKFSDQNIKELMYADDTTLLLSDFESMKHALNTVNEFCTAAGMKLNVEKTEGILLGPLKNTMTSFKGVKFTNEAIRCLGIYLGHDKNECYEFNWQNKLDKIRKVFERWKHRNLTVFGKILIIKSLAASKLYHVMSRLDTPDEILKEFEKISFNFLWESSDRIKRKTLIGNKSDGGLKMLDIQTQDRALKAGWIRRVHTNCYIRKYLDSCLKKIGINVEYLIKCHCDVKTLKELTNLSDFWIKAFAAMFECKSFIDDKIINTSELLSQPNWLNIRFKFNGKPIFITNWAKSNILYVKDLFDPGGDFISEQYTLNILINKHNWIPEYYKIRKIMKKLKQTHDTGMSQFINIKNKWTIVVKSQIHSLKTQRSKFFYEIMVAKKFEKNYMQRKWELDFNIESTRWKHIYKDRIWDVKDKKLAEYHYKLISNILCTKSVISKWNKNMDSSCPLCRQRHTVKHLLYECEKIKHIWAIIGNILKVDISYKHLIIGDHANNDFIKARNLVISYCSYAIYKMWVMSENKKINLENTCILSFIKKDIFSRTLYTECKYFTLLCDKIICNI